MKVLLQPKGILLIISLLTIVFGMLTAGSSVDFHIHDTYFVVSNLHTGVFLGVFFLLQATIYFLTDNYRQWRSIQYFHVLGIALIIPAIFSFRLYTSRPYHYASYDQFSTISMLGVILAVLFLLGQILFIINMLAGFIRGKKVLNHIR